MSDDGKDNPQQPAELPAIDFQSPGRFEVHNPEPLANEPSLWEPAPFELGVTPELQRFSERDAARMHTLALLQQARRSLCIYTPDFEPWLYDHLSIQQACSRFLLASPRNQLRILVQDSTRAVREGHKLLHLARRLTSNFQLRKLNPDGPVPDSAWLIADDCGLILRNLGERFDGQAHYNAQALVRKQQETFDRLWDSAVFDPDLRSFLL